MERAQPRDTAVNDEVLERIVARFVPVPPNGLDPPSVRDVIQLRIGTLAAETTWPEISELTGVHDANGDTAAITAAFPAVQEAARRRYDLTRRLMIRVWVESGLSDRLIDRIRPGSLDRSRSEWLVWGDRAERWAEEP